MTNQTITPLSYLGWALQENGFQVVYAAPDAELGYEQLLVIWGQDKKGRDLILKLVFAEDIASFFSQKAGKTLSQDYGYILQFLLVLPLELNQPVLKPELAHLLGVLNRVSPLGSFGFNQAEGVFLKYSLVLPSKEMNLKLIADILETLGLTAKKYISYLDAYFSGKYQVDSILQSIEKKKT